MKKANFFATLFFNSKKVIINIQSRIQVLEKEIKSIELMDNKVEAIVRLFQVISPIEDAGGFSQEIFDLSRHDNGKFSQQIEALLVMQKHFYLAGRSEYGINRTKKGEEVNADKVYLGDIFGIETKTATYWLGKKEELQKTLRPDVSKNPENPISTWYIINDHQCGGFVKSHTDGILAQIAILKAVA